MLIKIHYNSTERHAKIVFLCNSLITLSQYKLPLKQLNLYSIHIIPSADITRCCSYALSCIPHLNTKVFYQSDLDVTIFLQYMTGLTD